MNETNNSWLTATTGTATLANTGYSGTINGNINSLLTVPSALGYSGTSVTTITDGTGITLQGNSSINYSTNQYQSNMTPKQVKVAVFTITRDADTNEITSTKFVKELWIERKNGTSLDLLVAKQLDTDFDPETTVVREIYTVSF
jgi:hypothetical protein